MKFSLDNSLAGYIRLLKPISAHYTTSSDYVNPIDALLNRSTNNGNWFNYDIGYNEMTTEIFRTSETTEGPTKSKLYRNRKDVAMGSNIIWPIFGGENSYDFGTRALTINPEMSSRGAHPVIAVMNRPIKTNPVMSVMNLPMKPNPVMSMNRPMKPNPVMSVMNPPMKPNPVMSIMNPPIKPNPVMSVMNLLIKGNPSVPVMNAPMKGNLVKSVTNPPMKVNLVKSLTKAPMKVKPTTTKIPLKKSMKPLSRVNAAQARFFGMPSFN
ncbi:unnamed protein product [Gordionus sp. m RMFG-2023]